MTLSTKRLSLREWTESDLIYLQKLRNDVALQARLLSTARGSSIADIEKWVNERGQGVGNVFFVVATKDSGKPIGYIQSSREPESTDGFRFGVCLDSEYQSQGYGSELMQWLEQFLEEEYSAKKIILSVDRKNTHAIECYKKCSYREVGFLEHHVKVCDEWCDVTIMEKLLCDEQSSV